MISLSQQHHEEAGVFQLLTELCNKTATKYCSQSRIPQKHLASNMRSHSYEIILKKHNEKIPVSKTTPIVDLLSYYYVSKQNVKNVSEYRRCVELKNIISTIRHKDFGENQESIINILRFLIGLKDNVKEDLSVNMYQSPFTFGLLDKMVSKPHTEELGGPQPYPHFPSHVFELPYSLKRQTSALNAQNSQTYTEYTIESFNSQLFLADNTNSQEQPIVEVKTFLSPMSLASMTSTNLSPYSECNMFNYPRLTMPRDLHIPSSQFSDANIRVSPASMQIEPDINQVFRPYSDDESLNIWELASQMDKDIPCDIWEVVSKLPPLKERQLIATSSREMGLWRQIYSDILPNLSVITEKMFIRHVMYLIIGVETNSFIFSKELNCFYMKQDLVLEGISKEHLMNYVSDLMLIGTYYRRLYNFAFNQTLDDHFHSNGLVYEAAREVIRRYLLDFRLVATEIYEECSKSNMEYVGCIPTLLQILYHMEPLKYEIETIAAIYKMIELEPRTAMPHGAELMSYLFNEISLVTHKKTAFTMFNSLFSICSVYFKFIERFIFEGELDDRFNEFFIRKDGQYVNCCSKRYWDKGFHITQSVAVPDFLRSLAKFILLCGKSLRLLKLCNPTDPLVLLISSDHPSVKCCATFEELERQQQVLDVYRTRCLFVSGEPVTFDQILLKREAERKAFTEMASLKQAETMEKIVAERKRLAQLIIAEKQHSLRVLEAAMAEAKAAKNKAKQREMMRCQLEKAAERATEEVDSRLRDDERNKIMEYYSKLNMEVEKSKIHMEWKIKRLQLDESRMQLLSTEERNLRREKLELEHQRNEENMAMSIQSIDTKSDDELDSKNDNGGDTNVENHVESVKQADSMTTTDLEQIIENSEHNINRTKAQTSSDVFSAICNVAKSIFGVSKNNDDNNCDNKRDLDAEGNIVNVDPELNSNIKESKTSSDVIGGNLDGACDNLQYLKMRQEAIVNKQKVMAHDFGRIDIENNHMKDPLSINVGNLDEENNKIDVQEDWTPYSEAKRNKLKVLGTEFDEVKSNINYSVSEPKTDAQMEALLNKQKVLGVEYNLPLDIVSKREPANIAQEEAVRNKKKVLGSEYVNNCEQLNNQKVLDVEYNIPLDTVSKREPANTAQEEAIRNKKKVLGSEYGINCEQLSLRRDSAKRSGLTLNLKPHSDPSVATYRLGVTPNTGPVTPGELFPRLDLETPTTADVPFGGPITSDVFTPRSEGSKDLESEKAKSEKGFLNSEGFDFTMIVDDETVETEIINDVQTEETPDNSHLNNSCEVKDIKANHSFFDLLDGSYSLDDFDPFGVKRLKRFTKDHFSSQMDLEVSSSCYTHPAVIMEEVKKSPYRNIFASHFGREEEDENKVTCDNIATLTACLQRSVMLPLTYQLEVVNNAILTHYLVNLDMYEHLRSLKDYFFLMDGEFSRSMCRNLFTELGKTLNPHELLNFSTLHNILDKALGSSISHVHKFSENLSFTIADSPLSFQHSSPDVLQCLSLTYSVSWPLNIILSQEALVRYAKVFQFLIKMRRIFWVLGEDFESLKLSAKLSRQYSRNLLKSPQYNSIQIYRHVMASLIRALDNYIVTTCILTSWTEFENDLKKARTLDDLYDCHVVYIKKVLFRCLLNNRSTPVMKLLNDIFTVILKFSRVLKAGEWQQKDPNDYYTHSSFAQLKELFHLFEKLAKYLHKVVTKLMECGYQRHLIELLTMVNLNGYYDPEKSKDEQNTTVQST